jgi:hypothetical protein
MKNYESTMTVIKGLRKSKLILPKVYSFDGTNNSGVEINTYGKGQVTGAMYTVPAHGQITIDFQLQLLCVTPEDINNLSNLIMSLLDASHQHTYTELENLQVSGGASFFGFFGWGGASASYSQTKQTMDSFGLSEANQETIVAAMMKIAQQVCKFNYSGTIFNKDYDYDVSGNLFGIVMDAVIEQDQYQNQARFLAPNIFLGTPDGDSLPSVGQLYQPTN